MLPRVVTTERLTLRAPVLTDAYAIFDRYGQDPEVTRYLIWRPHRTVEETRAFVQGCIDAWDGWQRFPWVITLTADGQVLGMLDARFETAFRVAVGYVLARAFWGKGYMPEELRAVIDLIWQRPEVYRVWAICDVDNPASARAMEKVGMVREGTLRRYVLHPNVGDEPRDALCYARTR